MQNHVIDTVMLREDELS